MVTRIAVDERVQFAVAEFVHCPAGVTNQVMMVSAVRKLVADATIVQRQPADHFALLE